MTTKLNYIKLVLTSFLVSILYCDQRSDKLADKETSNYKLKFIGLYKQKFLANFHV